MESQVIVHQSIYIITIQYLLFIQHYYKGILIFSFMGPHCKWIGSVYIFVTLFITQERKKNYDTKKKEFIVFV